LDTVDLQVQFHFQVYITIYKGPPDTPSTDSGEIRYGRFNFIFSIL